MRQSLLICPERWPEGRDSGHPARAKINAPNCRAYPFWRIVAHTGLGHTFEQSINMASIYIASQPMIEPECAKLVPELPAVRSPLSLAFGVVFAIAALRNAGKYRHRLGFALRPRLERCKG